MTINVIMNTTGASNQQLNRRLQNSRRNSLNNLEKKIEAVAYRMLSSTDTLSPKEIERLDEKLIKLVLEYKGFRAFAKLDLLEVRMEDMPNYNRFSPDMFFRCYKSAWKSYSQAGIAKSKTDPFLKHFNAFYKKRISEIDREHLSDADYWNQRAQVVELSSILKEAKAKSKYGGYLPQINVLNKDKFIEQLQILGADQKLIEKAYMVYGSKLVGTDSQADSEGEETNNLVSDSVSHSSALLQERMMMYIADSIDRASQTARAEKNVFIIANLPYYVTLKALPYMTEQFNMVRILLEDFLDKDLLEFAKTNESENYVEMFSVYQNQQYNTARKKLRKVEKWLGEWVANAA